MFEIAARCAPFLEVEDMLVEEHIQHGGRPSLAALPRNVPVEYVTLMKMCWAAGPEQRPKFGAVVRELQAITSLHDESMA
jgi:hypothetical protein